MLFPDILNGTSSLLFAAIHPAVSIYYVRFLNYSHPSSLTVQ